MRLPSFRPGPVRRTLAALALGLCGLAAAGAADAAEVSLAAPSADEDLTAALEAASLLVAAERDGETNADQLVAAAQADYGRLLAALYAQGHYGGVITIRVDGREASGIAPLDAPEQVDRVEITVRPGPLFTFGRVEVAPLAPGTALPDSVAAGAAARTPAMRQAVETAIEGWRETGRPKARATDQSITADHRNRRVDAAFIIDPGRLARFGRLIVTGESRVRPDRIRAIAGLPSGERFSPEALERAAGRLRRAGAFGAITLSEGEVIGPDGRLDITAQISDRKPRRIGGGAEFSIVDGLTLSGFWLHRNLRGGAERLRFDAEIAGIGGETGGVDYVLSTRFTRPATFTPDTTLSIGAEIGREDEPDYLSDRFEADIGVEHIFSERFGDRLTGRLAVGTHIARVEDDQGERDFTFVTLPAGLTWDGRDDRLEPTAGLYGDLEATPFTDLDAGTTGLWLTFDGRAYRQIGPAVLAGRLQLGSLAGAAGSEVPPDYLFYSGGGGTVRGQDYQSLGIDLGGGDSIGGRSFTAVSLEARMPVTGPFGMAVFADAGYVGAEAFPDGSGDWHAGAGLGLRYDTGIGPLRVDLATPVRGGESGSIHVYIGIGQAF
ncbi:autotransporter assembly complex protein TamA [Rhodovulum sp. YNF3179]|uniref:autotransporter assembly complex protein TamA n=1 Tax=Rhodovulum sp. YNF3179 TaxID=3425127 RepID=UPI003D353678